MMEKGWNVITLAMSRANTVTSNYPYTPVSAHMSPETIHKLLGFYMEVLILGAIHVLQYMVSASLICFL